MSTRSERTESIGKLEKVLSGATGIYLTNFNKINVGRITRFRADLRKAGAKYVVVKNTLARIAFERSGISGLGLFLTGQTGIAVTKGDAVAPAKVIKEFQKSAKNLLELKVARIEGVVFTGVEALKVAELPGKEVLMAQLLSCLVSPMSNLVGTLNGILSKLVWTLDAVKNHKESENN
jgi:large subunit ribosomal protein L10